MINPQELKILTQTIKLNTKGYTDIIDITGKISQILSTSGITEGTVLISAVGSTTGITTVEYEPGLVNHDISNMLDKLAPYNVNYEHNKTWGDNNGAAHLRSSLIGTSQSIPFSKGNLHLGTWQQIVFMDFDTRPRDREIIVQIMGVSP